MRSIRETLTRHMMLWIGIILVLNAVVVFVGYRGSMRAQLDDTLEMRARTFAAMVLDDREDDEIVFEFEGPVTFESMGVWVRVTAGDEVLAVSANVPPGVMPSGGGQSVPGDAPIYSTHEPGWGARYRRVVLASHALIDDEESDRHLTPSLDHPVVIEVIADAGALLRGERALATVLGVGFLLALVVTAFVVRLGIGRGLAPVHLLRDELDLVSTDTLSIDSAEASYPDELRPIAAAVNGLLDRVRAGVGRERRFTDAAAHELRTPIAELTMIADVARRYPDEARQRRAIVEAGAIADEMKALLESLLMVARGRTAENVDGGETTALLPLVKSQLGKHAETIGDRAITVEIEGDERAGWDGPSGGVLMIVRNLIDNAVEYTGRGGSIRVSIAVGSFEIENGPVDLEPGEAGRLFEPFWRADTARSGRGHAGLGLSIVDAFCETLGLARRAVVTQDRCLRVRIAPEHH